MIHSSGDRLALHQPGSMTWAGRIATPGPSGRARDRVNGPAVTRFNSLANACPAVVVQRTAEGINQAASRLAARRSAVRAGDSSQPGQFSRLNMRHCRAIHFFMLFHRDGSKTRAGRDQSSQTSRASFALLHTSRCAGEVSVCPHAALAHGFYRRLVSAGSRAIAAPSQPVRVTDLGRPSADQLRHSQYTRIRIPAPRGFSGAEVST